MRILVTPANFKHSLSAREVTKSISQGIKSADVSIEVVELPVSDGGEGFVDTILKAKNGKKVHLKVRGPLYDLIESYYGIIDENTAVIEMALASGIELIGRERRDPTKTSTFGTGELIKNALENGIEKFIIGIGGSATNDGGIGMARALGFKFLDKAGNEIENILDFQNLEEIIFPENYDEIKKTTFTVASDVENKLLGERGASAIYGPQKGADENQIEMLDKSLSRLAEVSNKYSDINLAEVTGSGAAGGLGFGILFFLKGRMKSGFNVVSELIHLEESIKNCDLVITGEGRLDEQSLSGKAPVKIARMAQKHNKDVIAICGTYKKELEKEFNKNGITQFYTLDDKAGNSQEAIKNARRLLQEISKEIFSVC